MNKETAHAKPDGSVRIVVAASDPGHPNWLPTAGHRNGAMLFRLTGAEEAVQPKTSVVPAAELA